MYYELNFYGFQDGKTVNEGSQINIRVSLHDLSTDKREILIKDE